MSGEGIQPLREVLAAKKHAIIQEWLARTLQTYPEHTGRFLVREKDPFRNPVGHTLREAFPALFDQLVGGMETAAITPLLDGIVRIRAVQDFSAGQAVAFIFLLKRVVRDALYRPPHPPLSPHLTSPKGCPVPGARGEEKGEGRDWTDDLAVVEGRIDELALLAFDLFMKCRERVYEIRANEARRRVSLLERMHRLDPSARARGPDGLPERQPSKSGPT